MMAPVWRAHGIHPVMGKILALVHGQRNEETGKVSSRFDPRCILKAEAKVALANGALVQSVDRSANIRPEVESEADPQSDSVLDGVLQHRI